MNQEISSGLRITFLLGGLGSLAMGAVSIFMPSLIIQLTGLDSKAIPAIQQAGAAVFGYSVAAFLAMRARDWAEVRIAVAASIAFAALSAVGAFYYVVLQGVATSGLIAVLIFSALLALALAYYYAVHSRATGMPARGS